MERLQKEQLIILDSALDFLGWTRDRRVDLTFGEGQRTSGWVVFAPANDFSEETGCLELWVTPVPPRRRKVLLSGVELIASFLSQGCRVLGKVRD